MRRSRRFVLPAALAVLLAAGVAAVAVTAGAASAADQPWMNTAQTPLDRANELLAAMTQAEKLTMMHGGAGCGYVGCVDANTRLGIPALHLQDGPVGAGDGFTGVTQLPAPVAGAASWDTALMNQYGQVLGSEQWGKGTNVVLAPTINIVRDPRWGRAFESFGEDPYLTGQIAAADIQGIQSQGPMAQVKHYAVYNQETNRNNTADNAIVSDRTEREIYLPAFETAVKQGGADSAMCSYSAINGAFACENGPLQNTVAQGRHGLHRVHHLRLGRDPLDRGVGEQRPRHGDARQRLLRHRAHQRGQQRPGVPGDHRRPRAPDPDLDVQGRPVRPRADRHHRLGRDQHAPTTRPRSRSRRRARCC